MWPKILENYMSVCLKLKALINLNCVEFSTTSSKQPLYQISLRKILYKTSTAAVDPQHLKVEFCRLRFPLLYLCYKYNLLISDVNYVNKDY